MKIKTYSIMNKRNWTTAISAFILLFGVTLMVSCSGAEDPISGDGAIQNQERMGTMSVVSLEREDKFDFIVNVTKSAGAELPDVKDFYVSVLNKDGTEVVKSPLTGLDMTYLYSKMDGQTMTLLSNKYKLRAVSLAEEPVAAFETPYYSGEKEFVVRISELATVDLVCELANVKVTVHYSDDFLAKVKDHNVRVSSKYVSPEAIDMSGVLYYPHVENSGTHEQNRGGYFKVPPDGILRVRVTGTRLGDGEMLDIDVTPEIENVKAKRWYKVNIGYQQTGTVSLPSVTVDYTIIDKEFDVEIPDGDGVIDGGTGNDNWEDEDNGGGGETGNGLKIVGANFNGEEDFDLSVPLEVSLSKDENEIDVRFDAPKGIKELYITINSDDLTDLLPGLGLENGIPFDIANLDKAIKPEGMKDNEWWVNYFATPSIGILPDEPIKEKDTYTFSVGGLMPMLGGVGGSGSTHTFGLKMVDMDNETVEASLKLKFVD